MSPSFHYAIAVGSNLADRAASIAEGEALLAHSGLVRIIARAHLIETEAVLSSPGSPQPAYLNGAWTVATDLGPHQLLHLLQSIETRCGRTRTVHWGPRRLDLDLLLRSDGLVVRSGVLTLPHPHLHQRHFVLKPLAEIAGSWQHPLCGMDIDTLLADLGRNADRPAVC